MKKQKVIIELVHPEAKIPVKMTEQAGCWDVYAAAITNIGDFKYIVDLGFKLNPGPDHVIVLIPRSSITKTWLIQQNSPGQGDADFPGTYKYIFRVLPDRIDSTIAYRWGILAYPEFPFKVGDRVGQIYLREKIDMDFEKGIVEATERDPAGFGTTGK